jgi:glycosyltransferase involved in cell wall biosynthesis
MELTIVMPVYNEEEILDVVISGWVDKLDSLNIDYEFCVYNDGSRDNTLAVLNVCKKKYPKLLVIDKKNSGHGPTILTGYKNAKGKWIFQIDSDNEIESIHFEKIWDKREKYDFLVGARANRESPLARKIITVISRFTVRILYGIGINDVNSPYRLYKASAFKEAFNLLPDNTFAPNVILSGYAALKKLRIFETPIPYKLRQTGEVSIRKWKLLKSAAKSLFQTIKFRFSISTRNQYNAAE